MANLPLNEDNSNKENNNNIFLDLLAAPLRGLEGAVQGVYNLADFATFDALPDYDTRFLGKSKTVAGGLVEGVSQFASGFIPFFGQASKLGKLGAAGKLGKASKLAEKTLGTKTKAAFASSVVSDFTLFDGQEARLSNLIEQFPQLSNPITQFLQAEDDDNEAVGRFKNVLEGLGLEAFVGGLVIGLRALKNGRKIKEDTGDPQKTFEGVTSTLGDDVNLILPSYKSDPEDVSQALEDTGPFSYNPAIEKAVDEGTDAKGLLESILKTRPEDIAEDSKAVGEVLTNQQKVVKELLNIADPSDLQQIKVQLDGLKSKGVGEYDVDEGVIRLDSNGGINNQVAVHEVIHGLTARKLANELGGLKETTVRLESAGFDSFKTYTEGLNKLRNSPELSKPVKGLIDSLFKAREQLGDLDEYGVKNLDELVAEAFSNPEFQKKLASIKVNENKTLWQSLVDAVKNLIGFKDVDNTLLSKVLREGADIIKMEGPVKTQRKTGEVLQAKGRPEKNDEDNALSPKDIKSIKDAFNQDSIEEGLSRGRIINYSQLDTSDQVEAVIDIARQTVEEKIAEPAKKTLDEMSDESDSFFEEANNISKQVHDSFREFASKGVEEARKVRHMVYQFKKFSYDIAQQALDHVKEWNRTGSEVSLANLKKTLITAFEVEAYYSSLGREQALGLVARRKKGGGRKLGLNQNEINIKGMRERFLNDGTQRMEEVVKQLETATNGDEMEAVVNKIFKISRKTYGGKLSMLREYWINSILSGPKTQIVNIMGNALTSVFSTAETVFGGLWSKNPQAAKLAITSWADGEMFKEALVAGLKAAWDGKNIIDPDVRAFSDSAGNEAITADNLGSVTGITSLQEKDSTAYKFVNKLGSIIRLPSKLLMGTDEFFKQLTYRRSVKIKSALEFMEQGVKDPRELANKVHDRMESLLEQGGQHYSQEALIRKASQLADEDPSIGLADREDYINKYLEDNYDENLGALSSYAIEQSRYLTFTRDLEEGTLGSSVQNFIQNHPTFSFVMPFVRTPINILKYAFERTPGVLLLKQERNALFKELKSSDPLVKSQAEGRVATAAVVTGYLYDTIANNREYVTGGGPKDSKQKEALLATGWQPYSFKFGDTYYSYQKLDPLGTLVGVVADLRDASYGTNYGFDTTLIERVVPAMIVTFQRNVTNKSYLSGLNMLFDMLSDPSGKQAGRMFRNLATSMVPFSSALSQIQHFGGTQEAREIRTLADGFLYKLPFGRDNLDPKRNLLGEELLVENPPVLGAAWPIAQSTDKKDMVFDEMAELNHAFRQPDPTYGSIINLLEYTNSSGQSAHDRRLELLKTVRIGNRTLRQSLEKLISSRKYQELPKESEPGLPSPRIAELNRILTKFRSKALNEAIKEFPELKSFYEQVTKAKRDYRGGNTDYSDILSMLQ